jgi:hypothetical protein
MMTGVYAARNVAGKKYDVWAVNVEKEYHEEVSEEEAEAAQDAGKTAGDRLTPGRVEGPTLDEMLRWAFAQYDAVALGVAVGTVVALGLFAATAAVLLGPEPHGPTLSLLSHFFMGYEVSWAGAWMGLVESWIGGFAGGFLIAKAVNLLVQGYENSLRRRIQMTRLDPLEATED